MDRGAWRATVLGSQRVRHHVVTEQQQLDNQVRDPGLVHGPGTEVQTVRAAVRHRVECLRLFPRAGDHPRTSGLLAPSEQEDTAEIMLSAYTRDFGGKVRMALSLQVLLAGGSGGAPPGFLGYCPQESALWPSLTVREHLEVSAAVKGLRRADAAAAITRLADALKLQDQMALPAKALPEGAKRKLSFALSILGSPAVLLLDEPTTGMDPEGQLQMWQLIRASFRNTARGALLTTHSMAEAEAVCDRVAVMVSGSLRCVGSIQHLKSKFSRGYLLEMKLKSLAQLEALHGEVLRIFPQAARQERFASLLVYKLPVEDVHPLSHAFFCLETVKQNFDLEGYSLSQCSLEQVFLELCKEQEWDNSDEEVDLSVKWKLLQEEP